MNVTVLGCGVFGMALGNSFDNNNCNVTMWSKFQSEIDSLKSKYLNIRFTTDLEKSVNNAQLIVIAIPVQFLDNTIVELSKYYNEQDIVIASKGIDTKNYNFAYEIVLKYISNANIGVISGGSFAVDLMNKKLLGLTLATKFLSVSNKIKEGLENDYIKIQYSDDMIGV